MVSTIVTTPGTSTANSYVTLAEATTYFTDRINADDWTDSADTDLKTKCLLTAAKLMQDVQWKGCKYYVTQNDDGTDKQALAFPREGTYVDGNFITHNAVDGLYIPREIKDMQCEQALFLFRLDADGEEAYERHGVSSFRRGSVSVTYNREMLESDLDYMHFSKRAIMVGRKYMESGVKLLR